MAQPVWVLSVDLQTKTATFQAGMAEAARSAKGAFNDIRDSAASASEGASRGTLNVRASLGLLDNTIRGNHAAAMADLVREFAHSGIVMSALPFAAVAGGLLLVGSIAVKAAGMFREWREEQERLGDDQLKFDTAINNVFNDLDKRLLQAGIRADELNGNHLAALQKQLQLIDRESMEDLVKSFESIAKAADASFADLKGHWYTFGIGSAGAQHALTQFQTQYDALLAARKDKQAGDLLAGTLASAEHLLAMQKQYQDNVLNANTNRGRNGNVVDDAKFAEAALELKKAGVGVTDNEVNSQERLVETLRDQVTAQQKVQDLKGTQKGTAKQTASNDEASEFIRRIQAENKAQEAESRMQDQARAEAIENLQQGEREKIAATERGSAERLAAIDAAIKEENAKGLQETSFYHSLAVQRLETVRESANEEERIRDEAAKEAAEHGNKMAALEIAALKEKSQLNLALTRTTEQQRLQEERSLADAEFQVKMSALDKQIKALDKGGKDYQNKLRALQDREKELIQGHENQITALKDKALQERYLKIHAAEAKTDDLFASGFASVIMRHQSFAAMMSNIGDQVVSGMIENAIKSMIAEDMTKERDAAAAARDGYKAGMKFPFPVNLAMAPALGAMAFASVMAFEAGGIVPGVGRGDIVPAVLTPGEHVADKELTNGLRGMVRNSQDGNRGTTHFHYRPNITVSTIDGDGIKGVLTEHADTVQKHFEQTLRRMNR